MKVTEKITIQAPKQKVWEVLTGFASYGEWNPLFPALQGSLEFDTPINLQIKLPGKAPKTSAAMVTGAVEAKYFSFSLKSSVGSWWYMEEHIFRLVPAEDNSITFINEAFCFGLSLKFIKASLRQSLSAGLSGMNREFKQRCEAAV